MKSRSTLSTWLSGLDRSRLARVLTLRKDAAAAPEPRSVGELADRLQRPASVALVLPHLTLPCLQAAEALAALGARASRDGLAELLGSASPAAAHALDAALEALSDRALVWRDGDGALRMVTPLRQAWPTPLGLDAPLEELLAGATSEELRGMLAVLGIKPPNTKQRRLAALVEHHSDADRVAALVARAPAATRKTLEQSATPTLRRSPVIAFGVPGAPGAPGGDPRPGARWALDRGLLFQDPHGYWPVRMPAEVALALRGPDWHAPFEPLPPVPRLVAVTSSEVEREAAAAATAFVARAAAVLSACATAPPARLKSGGIGARELARLGRAAQADDAVVRLTLETAYAAGLLARDGDRVLPTTAYDAWSEPEPAERLAVLLRAWRDLPLTPPGRATNTTRPSRARRCAFLRRLSSGPPRAAHRGGGPPGRTGRQGRIGAGATRGVAPSARRRRITQGHGAVQYRDPGRRTAGRAGAGGVVPARRPPGGPRRRRTRHQRPTAAASRGHDGPDRPGPHGRRHRHAVRATRGAP
ncbi:hypothetical protein ACFYN0_11535 [Streptomyces sp. NPDC006704]|uniref:hypothetical protein n=1 Tax=Streptomyces sp. NPDC006704 TaxID=3364760 RepID=UPI0036AA7619